MRFIATAFAVSLGVAFIVGTSSLSQVLDSTFSDLIGDTSESTDAYVRAEGLGSGFDSFGAATTSMPIEFTDELETVEGVKRALPDINGSAVLVGAQGTAVRSGGAPSLGLPITEGDPVSEVIDGRYPTGADEIVVEESTLANSGLNVGDDTEVVIGAERRAVTIVGEATGTGGGPTVVYFPLDEAIKLFAPDGQSVGFTVAAEEGVDQEDLVSRIEPLLDDGFEVVSGEDYVEETTAQIKEGLSFFTIFMSIFALVALLVGAFIIANTFLMLLSQRTQELAMLRAVGMKRKQVLWLVIGEALFVGLVGSLLGFALGLVITVGLLAMMNQFGFELSLVPPITATGIGLALFTGIVVTVAAATFPALNASKIAPVAAMRSEATEARASLKPRIIGAIALFLGGIAFAVVAESVSEHQPWFAGAAAALLLLSTLVGAAPLVKPIVGAMTAAFSRSAVGRLAADNTVRNPKRTALTGSALTIGIALVSCVSVLATSAQTSLSGQITDNLKADFIVSAGFQGLSPDLSDQIAEIDGVDNVVEVGMSELALADGDEAAPEGAAPSLGATVVDLASYEDAFKLNFVDGDSTSLGEFEVALQEEYAEDEGLTKGSTFTATLGAAQDKEFTVAAIYEDNGDLDRAVISPTLLENNVPEQQRVTMYLMATTADGFDNDAVQQSIVDVVKPLLVVSVQTGEEYADAQSGQLQQMLMIVWGLLGLSIIIAGLGIANTLGMSLFERTREIGMLRAIGLKRGQLSLMVVAESIWTAIFGALIGVSIGLLAGIILQRSLTGEGLTELGVPWPTLVVVVLGAALVGVISALMPAYRAARINVLEATAVT